MLHFSSILWLAATCLLVSADKAASHVVTTCNYDAVHRLSCDSGVISIQRAFYGREDTVTCSEGRPAEQIPDTSCSMSNARDILKKRCDGKTVCEVNHQFMGALDPCRGISKYLRTEYTCLPAMRQVTCEHSMSHLQCDVGQVIFTYGAYYGRTDQTTCSYNRPSSQTENVDCSQQATQAAESCNGKNSCVIHASNLVFGDPCVGTYKYLEMAYVCEYPSPPKQTGDTEDV